MPVKKITDKELDTVVPYMVLQFGYSSAFVLPYADGTKIVEMLGKAEQVDTYYESKGLVFKPEALTFTSVVVSQREYRKGKMELLLGVHDDED